MRGEGWGVARVGCGLLLPALFAGTVAWSVAAVMPPQAAAQSRGQTFQICVVDEDAFQIKEVRLYLSTGPGQFTLIEQAGQQAFEGCGGEKRVWRYVVTNSLDTPGNRAIVELDFKTQDEAADSNAQIDSTVTLPVRLLALNKIGEPDNRVEVWVPASIPESIGPAYLDTLEKMSAPHGLQKLIHAAILYDRLKELYGPSSDVARRAAIIAMNAATDLIAQDSASESLFDIPDFVVRTIEDSLGRKSYWQRIVRRFEESRSAPIVKADQLIRGLIRTGQCNSARDVLAAISAYVGEEEYLLREARVPTTHLDDLSIKIDRDCQASG